MSYSQTCKVSKYLSMQDPSVTYPLLLNALHLKAQMHSSLGVSSRGLEDERQGLGKFLHPLFKMISENGRPNLFGLLWEWNKGNHCSCLLGLSLCKALSKWTLSVNGLESQFYDGPTDELRWAKGVWAEMVSIEGFKKCFQASVCPLIMCECAGKLGLLPGLCEIKGTLLASTWGSGGHIKHGKSPGLPRS